jgi:hypothetical protein
MKFLAAIIVALVMFGAMGVGAAFAHPSNGNAAVDTDPIFNNNPNFSEVFDKAPGILQGFVAHSPQCPNHTFPPGQN